MWQFVAFSALDLVAFTILGLMVGGVAVFLMPGNSVLEPTGRGRQLRGVPATLAIGVVAAVLAGMGALYLWPSAEGHSSITGFAAAIGGAVIALWLNTIWPRFIRVTT